jgi:hypothetical protein
MQDVYVSADAMTTLFLTDKTLEPIPEPIRMQPSVRLIVSFSEYIDFCRTWLQGKDKDYLSTPTAAIRKFLEEDNEAELIKCFYKDMAIAIGKELHYAEKYKKPRTAFYHTIDNPTKWLTVGEICTTVDQYTPVGISFLYPYLAARQFHLPATVQTENFFMWSYMIVLGWFGRCLPCKWIYTR